MHDLEKILDEVREKYYHTDILPRPSISWSNDYEVINYGRYHLGKNQIIISKCLDDEKISKEAISFVVYRESLHQEFGDGDKNFKIKLEEFKDIKNGKVEKELLDFMSKFYIEKEINDFSCGKEKLMYIVLPKLEDFSEAFKFYNGNIYVNFKIKISEKICEETEKYLFVFLTEEEDRYRIVGWTNKGNLMYTNKNIIHEKFGGENIIYQLYSKLEDMYILFYETSIYTIRKINFSKDIKNKNYSISNIHEEGAKFDIKYMNNYCLGFDIKGIKEEEIFLCPSYENIENEKLLKKIEEENSLRSLWIANFLYEKEKNFENRFERCYNKTFNLLIDMAYDEMKALYKEYPEEEFLTIELIKLCAMKDDFVLGKELISKLRSKEVLKMDDDLDSSVKYLRK